jgi:hypothetical protein
MPRFNKPSWLILLLCLAALLQACSSTPRYNPTVFPYEINDERLAGKPIKTVVIAHVNLGLPSRTYLEKEAPRIDSKVSAYLKENGFKVLPQREFEQRWNTAVRAYGDPVDPTTGKVNMKTFSQIMMSVRDEMRDLNLDAFIFTDLVELQTAFSGGLQHLARWDGVTRKPSLQGPGDGVTADFDWSMLVAVASLQVSIYDMDLQRVFASRGGIDATEAIDTRSASGRYIRRRQILENDSYIQEGIELAFYPFIDSENWPGNPD